MKLHYLNSLFLLVIILDLSTNIYGLSSSELVPKKILKPLLPPPEALLSIGHYHGTCPDAEGIISQKVAAWIKKDPTLAPSIIRLHFHDCAIRVITLLNLSLNLQIFLLSSFFHTMLLVYSI
jgi:peroxidase